MPEDKLETAPSLSMRQEALSRWDNEGGAGPGGPQKPSSFAKEVGPIPDTSNAGEPHSNGPGITGLDVSAVRLPTE